MKLKTKFSTLLVLILLVVVIGFSLFSFAPHLVKVFNLKQKLNTRQTTFYNLQQELNNKKSLLETKWGNDLAKGKLLQAIPYQMQSNQFLNQIKDLITNTKLKLNKYMPEDMIKEEEYVKLPILLEVTGDYKALNTFFKELEELNRLVTVEKIKILNQDEQLKSELLVAIYSLTQAGDKR